MKQEELMRLLPHRDNMLLIDEAEVADGVARGRKTIRGDEWFLKGLSGQSSCSRRHPV